jgi:hypothetical protein
MRDNKDPGVRMVIPEKLNREPDEVVAVSRDEATAQAGRTLELGLIVE